MTPPAEAFAWRLRGHLYRRIGDTGTVPSRPELAAGLAAADTEVDQALRFLEDACVLALNEHGEVWMAHPFSSVPTPYRLREARPARASWSGRNACPIGGSWHACGHRC